MKSTTKEPVPLFSIPAVIVRILSVLVLGIVIAWLAESIAKNDLALPGKYSGTVHFHGWAVWFFSGAIFCFALSFLGLFNAPRHYHFNRWMRYVSYGLFAIGFVVAIIQNKRLPQPSDLWAFLFFCHAAFSFVCWLP